MTGLAQVEEHNTHFSLIIQVVFENDSAQDNVKKEQ